MEENKEIEKEEQKTTPVTYTIDGQSIVKILDKKNWFQPIENGRQVNVGTITAARDEKGKCFMEARIDDETIRYDINPEVLIRFGQLDDANRLKLFDSVFHEVMIKNADGKDTDNRVDGAALSKMKEVMGFYHNVDNGREVDVTEVRVDRSEDGRHLMSATINGKERTKEILERTYDKFLVVDDDERIRIFANVFRDLKVVPRSTGKTDSDEKKSIRARILGWLGLCTIKEKEILEEKIRKMKGHDSEKDVRHKAEQKRKNMSEAAATQRKNDMKEIAENWKAIKDRYEKYEQYFGPEKLAAEMKKK